MARGKGDNNLLESIAAQEREHASRYVESPAAMEKAFQAVLERKRQELNDQRAAIQRMAAIARLGRMKST